MGHVITADGLKADPIKIHGIHEMPKQSSQGLLVLQNEVAEKVRDYFLLETSSLCETG